MKLLFSRSHTDKVETMINKYLKGTSILKAGGSGMLLSLDLLVIQSSFLYKDIKFYM